jgi:hypothetical protein
MMVVGVQVMSDSDSVSETTYFWALLIQSENGSPPRSGHAPVRHLIRAPALKEDLATRGVLVDHRAHHLRVEELERPATVTEPAGRVLVLAARRLHDAVETHELADENSHRVGPFVEASKVSDVLVVLNSSPALPAAFTAQW